MHPVLRCGLIALYIADAGWRLLAAWTVMVVIFILSWLVHPVLRCGLIALYIADAGWRLLAAWTVMVV
ncbi:hypothetical protein CQA86_32670, partial [Klebsiella pneumoniae]